VNDKKRQRGGGLRTDRLTVTVEGELIGRLNVERLKRSAVLIDRSLIWYRTAIAHCSGRDTIHRQEAGIGIEAQRDKENEEYAR
jgi:hypothetical protein